MMPTREAGWFGGSKGSDRSMQGRSSGKVVGQRERGLALRGPCPSQIGPHGPRGSIPGEHVLRNAK
jgi:hypothetical protein